VPLVEDKLFALIHPYELDGRTSSHPHDVRGFSTMNCYLLVEDERAVLCSTGYSAHEQALLAQLDGLVGDRPLALMILRVEFTAMCNARPIADRFRVEGVYQLNPATPSEFLNFRPGHSRGDDADGLRGVPRLRVVNDEPASVDRAGARRLEFVMPELRILPSHWVYDHGTRTLFTGDLFCWVWHDTPDGPWLIDGDDGDPTTQARVTSQLVHNRYWWLPGARTAPIRRALADLFDRLDVATIAPDHGAVLTGPAVARHYDLLDECLAAAPELPAQGVAVGGWTTAGAR
jgi:hypothetical protein